MSDLEQALVENRLLARMPAEAFQAIREGLEPHPLPRGKMLVRRDAPADHIHFPVSGLGSIVANTAQGQRLEIGIFGREGVSGTSMILGADRTPHETFMQIEGASLRLPAAIFSRALETCEPLRAFLLLYVQVQMVQTAQTALSNVSFNIDARTARWLLMCHDRIGADALPLTHEFLGVMLGVRRSSVTDSIHVLEGMGLIRATRGEIVVRDRAGLEQLAGGSYGAPEAEYERLLGDWR